MLCSRYINIFIFVRIRGAIKCVLLQRIASFFPLITEFSVVYIHCTGTHAICLMLSTDVGIHRVTGDTVAIAAVATVTDADAGASITSFLCHLNILCVINFKC